MSAIGKAVRTFRAERRRAKSEDLYRRAVSLKRQAAYLEAVATRNVEPQPAPQQKSDKREPYDEVKSGEIRVGLWHDSPQNRPVFGLRWQVVNDGLRNYRTTVPATMYHDVITALAELALRYSQEPRLPEKERREFHEYATYLTWIPSCVKNAVQDLETIRPTSNGRSAAPPKRVSPIR